MKKARYHSGFYGYDSIFAQRLWSLMSNTDTTQAQLAEYTGTTRQAISQYMNGNIQPNVEKLYKIAKYFDVTSDYLIGLTDHQTHETAAIGEITGLSDKAIAALRCFNACFKESDHGNILPLVNFLLASEMSPAYVASMQSCLEQLSDLSEEPDSDAYLNNVIRTSSGEVLLDRKLIETYGKLCGKPVKGYPVLTELLKYFDTAANDKDIYLSDKGDLSYKPCGYGYKLSQVVEQMLLSSVQKSLETRKKEWQALHDNADEPGSVENNKL